MFLGSQAVESAVLTPTQLRSSAWMRLGRDVYADSRLERDHELACRAAALALPAGIAFAGPSAAVLLGVAFGAKFTDPVHVIVPDTVRLGGRRDVRVHRVDLLPGDLEDTGNLPRTSAVRTVWDLASWFDPVASVPIIDNLLRLGMVERNAIGRYIMQRPGERGSVRAAQALELADDRAESPQESRLRVRLVQSDLPAPVPQFAIQIGRLTVHPDLAWPEFKVAVEYDGLWHADTDQFHRDRRRLNLLMGAGWIVLHVTSERLRRDFPGVLKEIRAALASRGWRG
jgi:very-short-patch-repair endonuclease